MTNILLPRAILFCTVVTILQSYNILGRVNQLTGIVKTKFSRDRTSFLPSIKERQIAAVKVFNKVRSRYNT